MQRFSENTLRILEEAGWFPGRHVSTEEFEAYVKQKNDEYETGHELIPNNTIKNFLHEFGGLTLTMYRKIPQSPAMDSFRTSTRCIPIGVLGTTISVSVEDEEIWIGGEKLYPISNDHDMLFNYMSYSGKVYGYCCGSFWEMGESGDAWIERTCNFYSGLPCPPKILIHQE